MPCFPPVRSGAEPQKSRSSTEWRWRQRRGAHRSAESDRRSRNTDRLCSRYQYGSPRRRTILYRLHPQQLDSIVNAQNWKFLLSDTPDPETTLLSEKLKEEQYLLSVPIAGKSAHVSDAGIIKGRNISQLLSELTVGYHDSISFNRLPIPFACVSDNIVNGSKVVFHNGILATAMRASMSIPGVFAPVYLNGKVLVDGGLIDNYPVDIARQMGAEIIIGVDVQNPLMKADELTSLSSVLGQIINLVGEESYRKNVKDSNIHIQVDVDGYSAASFNSEALDTLMRRGKEAAMKDWEKLIALKKK